MENIILFLNGNKSIEDFLNDLSEENLICLNKFYEIAHSDGIISSTTYDRNPSFNNLLEELVDYGLDFSVKSTIYDFTYEIVNHQGIDIKYYEKYKEQSLLSIKYIPDYLNGGEASKFIEEEIFSKMPNNLSKKDIAKYIKEECKKLFHIEGNKFPRWAQSCEWPLRNGIPCKYIKQRKIGEMVQYYFLDVITNEEIIIEQYY